MQCMPFELYSTWNVTYLTSILRTICICMQVITGWLCETTLKLHGHYNYTEIMAELSIIIILYDNL